MGKGEIARYEQFLLCPQCFQKFDENGRKLFKWVGTLKKKEKLLITSNFSFTYSVFKRLVLETFKNHGLLGKELMSQ